VVLADQAASDLPALESGGDIDGLAGLPLPGVSTAGLVRTMPVTMLGILGQDHAEMRFAENQQMVHAPYRLAGLPEPVRVEFAALGNVAGKALARKISRLSPASNVTDFLCGSTPMITRSTARLPSLAPRSCRLTSDTRPGPAGCA
jgi:hypothetical protein